MATSRTHILSEIIGVETISPGALTYLEHRLANRLYDLFLEEFVRQEQAGLITRAKLARRINKDPAQISRFLGGEGNWTVATISALLGGMGMEPGPLSCVSLADNAAPAQRASKAEVIDLAEYKAVTVSLVKDPKQARTLRVESIKSDAVAAHG